VSKQVRATERPATFREVFGNTEYRALYSAAALSWFGDYLARVAVAAMVYQRTNSVAASAAAFASSYLPWIIGGPVLAAIAERHRYRTVMVSCDVARMALIALVAIPGINIPVMLVLLFAVALINPPAQAAKSAVMPLILTGDRLVVGLSLNTSTGQAAQVLGYLAGGALAPFYPRLALLIDAATFGLSAALIRFGVRDRPPALAVDKRSHLLKETADGYRLVFGSQVLRAIAILVFSSTLFAIVPEGLAAAWAGELVANTSERGLIQGIIMVANPLGWVLGSLLVGRLVRPDLRRRLMRVFAVLAPLMLVPALANPPITGVVVMSAACGFAVAGMLPAANALFVQALPNGFRARAFGVMQSGVQITQGLAVVITGLLADQFALYKVVGVWSVAGVLLLVAVGLRWPAEQQFTEAVEAAALANRPAEDATAAGTAEKGALGEPVAPETAGKLGSGLQQPPSPNGRASGAVGTNGTSAASGGTTADTSRATV
jgi:MFS family permease